MISPASASNNSLPGSGTVIGVYRTDNINVPPNTTFSHSITYPTGSLIYYTPSTSTYDVALGSISTDRSTYYDTEVGFYVSYFIDSPYPYLTHGDPTSPSAYSATYYNSANQQGEIVGGIDVATFTPVTDRAYSTPGITLKGIFVGTETAPVTNLTYTVDYTNNFWYTDWHRHQGGLTIVSAKIVEASSGADLEALQGIADQIANQSEILSAMYGDIMEVLNAIYARLGDMQATQNLAMNYFNSMTNYLNGINTNVYQIYTLLQSQFQLLIATINTASTDIQGAISQQTEDLKTYFDSVFNSAVGTLPDDTDSAQGVIDDAHENDEQYTADALGKFEEISATFQGFDGSVGSGVAVASTLFSRVWTAMGDYVIVYTFPLTLALALVIVGRLSRVHSKDSSKSKGGDDSG